MKKAYGILAFLLIMLFVVSGCSSSVSNNDIGTPDKPITTVDEFNEQVRLITQDYFEAYQMTKGIMDIASSEWHSNHRVSLETRDLCKKSWAVLADSSNKTIEELNNMIVVGDDLQRLKEVVVESFTSTKSGINWLQSSGESDFWTDDTAQQTISLNNTFMLTTEDIRYLIQEKE